MNLQKFYEMQAELDAYVADNLEINLDEEEYIEKRVFALKVELAELANEVAFFKYWKQSHEIDNSKVLEEWADVSHFFLSVGLSRKYDRFVPELNEMNFWYSPTDELFYQIMVSPLNSAGQWKEGFERLVQLGQKLEFSLDELEAAYTEKWEKNFKRQQSNY